MELFTKPDSRNLWFRNVAQESERIANGLKALAIAETILF